MGPLQYPVPKCFEESGGLVGYGYENSVLLIRTITIPPDAKPGSTIELNWKSNWLSCKDVCIPGQDAGKINVAIVSPEDERTSAVHDEIESWSKRVPRPVDEDASVHQVDVAKERDQHIIKLTWVDEVEGVECFPAAGSDIAVEDLSIKHSAKTATISFKVKNYGAEKDKPEPLLMVVQFKGANQDARAVAVSVPLR